MKHEKHLQLLSSGTKLFLLSLSLKVLRHKERDTHSFYSGFSICPPISCDTCPRPRWASESRPFSFGVQFSTPLTDFYKIPKILRARFRCITSFTSTFYWIFILTSVNDTSSLCARQHLCSSLHLTHPCAEPKGSQPN